MISATSPANAVLVVDDEALVRMCAVQAFLDSGFTVFDADCGEEALETLARHPEVGVLFTDINMPGRLDGLELARRVRQLRPDMLLFLTSGRDGPKTESLCGGVFIAKPYDGATITALVRAASEKMRAA